MAVNISFYKELTLHDISCCRYVQQYWLELWDYIFQAVLSEAVLGGGSTKGGEVNGTTSASVVESLSSVSTAEGVSNDPEAARLLTPSAADVAVAVKFAAGSNGPGRSARRRRMRLAFSSPRLVLPVHPLSPNYLEADLGNWKLAN